MYTASVQPLIPTAKHAPSAADAEATPRRSRPLRAATRIALSAFLVGGFFSRTGSAAAPAVPDDEVPLSSAIQMSTLSPCFDRAALTSAIEQWLERSTVDSRLRVVVYVDGGIPSFSIRLGDDPPLVRRFDESAQDCETERDALALSIALAIDAVAPTTPRAREPVWALEVSGVATTPWTERINWGGAIGLGLRASRYFEPQIGALFVLAGDQPIGTSPTARLDTRLILARASGCFTADLDMASVLACGGLAAGPSTLSATGLSGARSESNLFWAAAGTAEIRLRITGDIGLHLAADVLVSLRRGTMRIDDTGGQPIYLETLPPVVAAFRLGPSAFF